MADDYTPTTEQVRAGFAYDGGEAEYYDPINGHRQADEARRAFDRWLAAHDREVAAAERERAAKIAATAGGWLVDVGITEYAKAVRETRATIAYEIRKETS